MTLGEFIKFTNRCYKSASMIQNSKSFRTIFPIRKSTRKINLTSKVLTLGSCFSDNIGNKLKDYKFNCSSNPFGNIFNPSSIFKILSFMIEKENLNPNYFITNNDSFYHYHLHSSISGESQNELLSNYKLKLKESIKFLKNIDFVFITFGTSIVYELISNNDIVANCHKIPSKNFNKRFLTIKEITDGFDQLHSSFPASTVFVLTVSPIRHIKETIEANSVSKSILRVACNELQQNYHNIDYFPSYEIMMDDLRDYRYYAEDMLHPSNLAIDYIWDIFQDTFFDKNTLEYTKTWNKLIKDLNHKPFNSKSVGHQKFSLNLEKKLISFSQQYNINVKKEIESLYKN